MEKQCGRGNAILFFEIENGKCETRAHARAFNDRKLALGAAIINRVVKESFSLYYAQPANAEIRYCLG